MQDLGVGRIDGLARAVALVGAGDARAADEVEALVVRILGEVPAKMHLVAYAR